eukprot:11137310-Ditylum_brightwellii.AAC.1
MPSSQEGRVEVACDTSEEVEKRFSSNDGVSKCVLSDCLLLCKVDWEDTLINENVHLKGDEITFKDRLPHVAKPTIP